MSITSHIDMARLPPPDAVEELDFEQVLAAMKTEFTARYPEINTLNLESEPVVKVLEVAAYREVMLRGRVNQGVRACMLASAIGTDLDNLAALYGIRRQVVTPADRQANPPVDAVMESDAALRRRTQLAPEGMSVAGPGSAYLFHALSGGDRPLSIDVTTPKAGEIVLTYRFDPTGTGGKIKDASTASPKAGEVVVTLLGRDGDGTLDRDTLDSVLAHIGSDNIRPLTDKVSVRSATIKRFSIRAAIAIQNGPDRDVVMKVARQSLDAHIADLHALGRSVHINSIIAALHVDGVENVIVTLPSADITVEDTAAPYCSAVNLQVAT